MDGRPCTSCREPNPSDARLCGMCGKALTRDEAAGEVRRIVTLVTSDLKGSTALGERLDPEALREVLNRYFAVMRAVFESHGGAIEKIIGDAIVAVFGLPFRRDDDPLRALEAAAESQRALATLNDELEAGYGVRLVVRTGVATGQVTFGAAEAGQHVLLGPPVDVSTVMEQNAPPLEVLVHGSTRDLVGDMAEFEDHPSVSPKGSDVQFDAFRLVSVHERPQAEDAGVPEAAEGMRICPSCGESSPDRMRYCTTCGASLAQAVVRESRRTVTIVFAMPKVKSTTGEEPGPDTLRDVISRYFDAMRGALERHGGTVEKFIGDAVMAVFGLPVRHEDDAVRAVRAAADMEAALAALNPEFQAGWGVEIENHIGVNSGEVIAGDAATAQRMVTGDAVNTAARLEQAAGPGEIVLGDLTYRLARDQIEVEFMAPLTLKGKAEPVAAYRLVSIGVGRAADAGQATPFVGREDELRQLNETLERAITDRRATLVAVVGDAGVGKSRLIREFAASAQGRARLVRGRCLPYGDGITFWPLSEVVRGAAGIAADDTPNLAMRRLHRLLERAGVTDERETIVERVAAAINLTAAQYPVAELMWGGRRFLEALATDRPTVMLVDDLHWAESTFLEFLDHLVESVEDASIVVLGSARHELSERHADWAVGHRPEIIGLQPLSESDSERIVDELLGALEPSVRARIAAAAEGNPLYVEQIVSMLVETGALQRGLEGWVAREGAAELQIPPTVQALVAARLDALGGEERAVVDPASVIGLSFPVDAVAVLVEDDVRPSLERDLEVLTAKQLVRRLPDEEVIYRFGHQVIRDTAYGSLLKRARAALHERFVSWAERVNRERGRELEFEEILGYHLEQAYRYRTGLGIADPDAREVGDRAAEKLSSAGLRALARGDTPAAANLLRRAIALLEVEDPRRLALIPELGEAQLTLSRFADAAAELDGGLEIARRIGDRRLEARLTIGRMLTDLFSGSAERTPTADEARLLLKIFTELGDEGGMARAWRVLLFSHANAGLYDDMAAAAEQVIEHATRAGEDRLVRRGAAVYATAAVLGSTRVPEAIRRCEEIAERVKGDRRSEAIVFGALALLHAMDGDFELARSFYRREQEFLASLGPSRELATTSLDSARVELLAGDPAAAERELRRDDAELEAMGETYFRSTVLGNLARTLVEAGRLEEADRYAVATQAMADPDDVDTQVLWRLSRSRLLVASDPDAALRFADEAVALAAQTHGLESRADAYRNRARILMDLGLDERAAADLEEALRLYELKGNRASIEATPALGGAQMTLGGGATSAGVLDSP